MKTTLLTIAIGAAIVCPLAAPAYTVYMPPNNIVQNPTFSDTWNHWSGNIVAGLVGWPTVPNNNALMATDVWQDLPTVRGQQYALDFYMGADLYFAPSVTVNVNVGGATLQTVVTPPYVYDNQLNRTEQVHWQEVSGLFTATGTTTRLEFLDTNTYDFYLASVSVIAVPEPTTAPLLIGGLGAFAISRRLRPRQSSRDSDTLSCEQASRLESMRHGVIPFPSDTARPAPLLAIGYQPLPICYQLSAISHSRCWLASPIPEPASIAGFIKPKRINCAIMRKKFGSPPS